jgi:hypothetical protein
LTNAIPRANNSRKRAENELDASGPHMASLRACATHHEQRRPRRSATSVAVADPIVDAVDSFIIGTWRPAASLRLRRRSVLNGATNALSTDCSRPASCSCKSYTSARAHGSVALTSRRTWSGSPRIRPTPRQLDAWPRPGCGSGATGVPKGHAATAIEGRIEGRKALGGPISRLKSAHSCGRGDSNPHALAGTSS